MTSVTRASERANRINNTRASEPRAVRAGTPEELSSWVGLFTHSCNFERFFGGWTHAVPDTSGDVVFYYRSCLRKIAPHYGGFALRTGLSLRDTAFSHWHEFLSQELFLLLLSFLGLLETLAQIARPEPVICGALVCSNSCCPSPRRFVFRCLVMVLESGLLGPSPVKRAVCCLLFWRSRHVLGHLSGES